MVHSFYGCQASKQEDTDWGDLGSCCPLNMKIFPLEFLDFTKAVVVFNECLTAGKLCTSKPVAITAAALV